MSSEQVMTDIVAELREFGATSNPGGIYENLPFAAADEIERLRAALKPIVDELLDRKPYRRMELYRLATKARRALEYEKV